MFSLQRRRWQNVNARGKRGHYAASLIQPERIPV
jgi:hypothetical protein